MPRVLFTLAVTLARRSSVAGVGAVSLMAMMPSSASAVGTGSLGAVDATSAAAEAGRMPAVSRAADRSALRSFFIFIGVPPF